MSQGNNLFPSNGAPNQMPNLPAGQPFVPPAGQMAETISPGAALPPQNMPPSNGYFNQPGSGQFIPEGSGQFIPEGSGQFIPEGSGQFVSQASGPIPAQFINNGPVMAAPLGQAADQGNPNLAAPSVAAYPQPVHGGIASEQVQPATSSATAPSGKTNKSEVIIRRVLITLLVLVLLATAGIGILYYLKPTGYQDAQASFKNGAKPNWVLEMPHFNGKRYTEKIGKNQLVVVSESEDGVAQAKMLTLPKEQNDSDSGTKKELKRYQNIWSQGRTIPLPGCKSRSDQTYRVENGKIVCNLKANKIIPVEKISGLNATQRENLGEKIHFAGVVDKTTIGYTNTEQGVSLVAGLSEDSKILWLKKYSQPSFVTVADNRIWVTESNTLTELVPAVGKPVEKETDLVMKSLNKKIPPRPGKLAYIQYEQLFKNPYQAIGYSENTSRCNDYKYALVDLDDKGIPGLLLSEVCEDSPGFSTIRAFLYEKDSRQIIKAKDTVSDGVAMVGGARARVLAREDGPGFYYSEWSGGTGEGMDILYQAVNGEIKNVSEHPFKMSEGGPVNQVKEISWYPVSDLKPLQKALLSR